MSTKVRTTTRYLLTEQLKLLGWALLAVVMIMVIIPLLFSLVTGNISNYSFTGSISNLALGVLFFFFIFIIESLTYDNFKLLIQNGISRRTYWQARVNTVVLLSLIGTILAFIYAYGVHAPLNHLSSNSILLDALHGPYVYFFGNNLVLGILVGMLLTWIFFIGTGLTGMACGSLLALFSKWIQRLLVIVVPVLGAFLLGFMISASDHQQTNYNFDGLVTVFKFLFGFPLHGNPKMGYLNPTMPVITMLIGCAIMGGLAYLFNRKLKIKN
ncbi:hypothetical protein [Lactiplantibacillus herbarum]|uniref:hypothetical protein n=1 Tax=Lactiplantibacillus herbarum TaxID=1670446 RepID=UPI00064FA04E|nr:hypothetical protein [Lactiplantibacillus herbarum]